MSYYCFNKVIGWDYTLLSQLLSNSLDYLRVQPWVDWMIHETLDQHSESEAQYFPNMWMENDGADIP